MSLTNFLQHYAASGRSNYQYDLIDLDHCIGELIAAEYYV